MIPHELIRTILLMGLLALTLGPTDVFADCCERVCQGRESCRPGDTWQTSLACRMVGPDAPSAGCVAASVPCSPVGNPFCRGRTTVACVGGRLTAGGALAEGCGCVGSSDTIPGLRCADTSGAAISRTECKRTAARACQAGGAAIETPDDPVCPPCPG